MKGGTTCIVWLLMIFAGHFSFAATNICDKIFEPRVFGDEYLPFPLIEESFFEGVFANSSVFYSPEAGLSLEISHLMGAEYLVKVTQIWDGHVDRGVLVYSEGTFSGFVQKEDSNVLFDFGAMVVEGRTRYYFQIDGQCYQAELENQSLR